MKQPGNIPTHQLSSQHATLHRDKTRTSSFGYDQLPTNKRLTGFEIYSTDGMIPDYGPAKSGFYRFGILTQGSLQVQLGLEHFKVSACALNFSIPGQIHAKSNVSPDIFGYYLLFEENFLQNLLSQHHLGAEFPFLNYTGQQIFNCNQVEIDELTSLLLKINEELHQLNSGRETAIKMYLYLMLLTARRSYERQHLSVPLSDPGTSSYLVTRFHKLVSEHFLSLRQVADYAALLHVTPNHLNRIVKNISSRTASDAISEMLAQEAKVLLRSTSLSAAEIAYQLNFSDPAAFSRFFKKSTGLTPLKYRLQETKNGAAVFGQ
ncbi:helix-turn-helix domain-containing protein [Chitinophaga filiformis]|uniref:Helix-turn-helix domain-containing protein n=1 Tax=Chitinophaga filiformis TaxID=104663 RepID=A0ABY4I2T2_CHIFI|nr:helix-turn-helix domain-containing protein [Chitinophaga filiformis]UPK70400.1 helix-turn-helix domain-containing protein [Chitinophaga filiformis]